MPLWKNSGLRITVLAACLACAFRVVSVNAQTPDRHYKLLLTPQRLRRLQRDCERKTFRWQNFEKRVETVPDSPERGFELALYYAVTHDEARGREAVQWAMTHPCDVRQNSLVSDWADDLFNEAHQHLEFTRCSFRGEITMQNIRDQLFADTENGQIMPPIPLPRSYDRAVLRNPADLYALCEYLIVVRATTHNDVREMNANFFRVLPKEFLLSLKPQQIEHPDWMAHIAALALVAVDPNLEGSQFLQGWALEENQTLRDGPGAAYEFLWADPYLPGIAYRNLDSWAYDPAGRLFARTNWEADSCWLAIDSTGMRQENCPPAALNSKQAFGSLMLVPISTPCLEVPARANRESLILWRMRPGHGIAYRGEAKKEIVETADAAGMWLVPENANGRVCQQQPSKP